MTRMRIALVSLVLLVAPLSAAAATGSPSDSARDLDQQAISAAHQIGGGLGLLTAVWEPQACINRAHPDFASVQWVKRPGSTACDRSESGGGEFQGHSTAVASALAADRGGTDTVGLYRARLVDIDDTDPANVDRMWALNPDIVNASFTTTDFEALRIDKEVYRTGALVFTGAGNDPTDTANCAAYNAICVGGYNMNVVGQYADDTFYTHSEYLNPSSGREFPELVGPAASRYASGTSNGYVTGGGTSFATPSVAGTAGLLLAGYPSLQHNDALVRAVLMASAQAHPIADGGPRIPITTDAVDDRHGVGAPNGGRAKAIMDSQSYVYDGALTPSRLGTLATVTVPMGRRVRAVVTWDQCPSTFVNPPLNADIDMTIRKVTKGLSTMPPEVHSNISHVDNWEAVEFVTTLGGTYSISLSSPHWSPCDAEGGAQRVRLGLAWTTEPAPTNG